MRTGQGLKARVTMDMTLAIDTANEVKMPEVHRSGPGRVVVATTAGQSHVIRSSATSPLKLLSPRAGQDCAWVFTSTYGGGLLGGDSISLDVEVGPEAKCLLSTQASTKVYRTIGPPSRQTLNVHARAGSLIVSMPDPIVCYGRSWYEQRQRFELDSNAGLVMLDWLTSGRYGRGERWAFDRYDSRTEVFVDKRCAFRDRIVLDPADGPLESAQRMGGVNCLATVLLMGEMLAGHVKGLLEWAAAQPAPSNEWLFSASPVPGGMVIRVAGSQTEQVARWIHQRLDFVSAAIGQSPWARKW